MPTPRSELSTRPRTDSLTGKDNPLPDPYDLSTLKPAMKNLGYRLLFLPQTLTTMGIVQERAITRDASLLVVLTDHQTQGVGRDLTKVWHDIAGCSILFSAFFSIDESATAEFADIVALRVCMALRQQGTDVLVKAPNDIVSSETGEKVSGILVQNIYGTKNTEYLGTNLGIGVNVHYTKPQLDRYPTDYGATSLDLITGRKTNRQQALISILEAIATAEPEARVINHTPSVRETQDGLWTKHSFLIGENVSVLDSGLVIQGRVVKTQIGRGIEIQTPDGKFHTVSIFDINTKVRLVN